MDDIDLPDNFVFKSRLKRLNSVYTDLLAWLPDEYFTESSDKIYQAMYSQ